MFKNDNLEDELFRSMEKTLVSSQVEQKHGFNKIAKAIDYLNKAANIFEKAHMSDTVEGINNALQKIADDLNDAKSRADYEEKIKKHAVQVRDRLATISRNVDWLQVDIKWLIPELQSVGNPEKDALSILTKGLAPDQFPMGAEND